MKIYLSPQVNQEKIIYEFEDKSFTATVKDMTDTFDFSEFSDGQLDVQSVETSLEINPILSAEIVDGELSVELVNYIGTDAPEHERFPEWIDHTDYERAKEDEANGEDDLERLGDSETRKEGSGEAS